MIILASSSPRRNIIMKSAGAEFTVRIPENEIKPTGKMSPRKYAVACARSKSEAVICGKGETVLSADTIVSVDGKILGKPKDAEEAYAILTLLSGRTHKVYTGYVIRTENDVTEKCEVTTVKFRTLTDSQINGYIATGEPMDKAGAYGVQGRACMFVEKINGDFFNVMGLPTAAVADAMRIDGQMR